MKRKQASETVTEVPLVADEREEVPPVTEEEEEDAHPPHDSSHEEHSDDENDPAYTAATQQDGPLGTTASEQPRSILPMTQASHAIL